MLSEDELALLDAIRATGSLSRAAARLGKAPSTVSHAARQLETRFDALLFDRRGYRLQLTPAGQLLTDEAARLALDVARLTQRVRQVASGWEDRLWIVSDEVLEFDTLLPVVRAFDALDSGVSLRFTHEVLGGTWEALRDGRADLVIGATNEPPAIPGFVVRAGRDGVGVRGVAAPSAGRRERADADAIGAHRAVVVADSSRRAAGRAYGLLGGQAVLAVPSMRAKILAQRDGARRRLGAAPARGVAARARRTRGKADGRSARAEPAVCRMARRPGRPRAAMVARAITRTAARAACSTASTWPADAARNRAEPGVRVHSPKHVRRFRTCSSRPSYGMTGRRAHPVFTVNSPVHRRTSCNASKERRSSSRVATAVSYGGGQGIRGRRRARHHHRVRCADARGRAATLGADALAIRNEAGSVASAARWPMRSHRRRGSTPCSSTRASRSSRRSPIATRPCGISCSTPT